MQICICTYNSYINIFNNFINDNFINDFNNDIIMNNILSVCKD